MKAEKVKNRKKSKRVFLIIGIIFSTIGIILAMTLFNIITINPQQMKDDEDYENFGWKSYGPGDEIIINGRITEKEILFNKGEKEFGYILNDDLRILSIEDIGSEGDDIIVRCEIQETSSPSINNGTPFEYLKVKSTINPLLMILPGIIIFILGVISISIFFFNRNLKPDTDDITNKEE